MKIRSIVSLILTGLVVVACTKSDDPERFVNKLSGQVLVRVDGVPVTKRDVDVAAIRMLGPHRAFKIGDTGRQKILESIVLSKIISAAAQKEVSPEITDSIARQTRDYREELLVKEYLRKHINPTPVTQDMIQEYYEKHPEQFGGKVIREYIALVSQQKTQGILRQKIVKALDAAKDKKNWRSYAKSLTKKGIKVSFKQGKTDGKLLHERLRLVLKNIKLKETSKPFLLDGKQYVVRVIVEQKQKPRALKEVGADIRKALAPGILKDAINKVSEDLKKTAKVEYIKTENR